MRVVDSHFHIYKNAQAGLMAQGGKSHMGLEGTIEEACQILDRGKIDRLMALAVIPIEPMRQAAMNKWSENDTALDRAALEEELEQKLAGRLSRYNDWLCASAREDGRMEPVIAADPTIDEQSMTAEILDKLERYRIRAIKIHPEVNGVFPSHRGYRPVFELAEQKELVVISHGGLSASQENYCAPDNFQAVLRDFPGLKLVIAHLAFPETERLKELAAVHDHLYTDISFLLGNSLIGEEDLGRTIRSFGIDRVLFGSDFPWSDPEKDLDRLPGLNLTDAELEKLTYRNAAHLFGLVQ